MRLWRLALLALGGLGRRPLRAVLTALGVAIAAGALVSMMAFALGLQRQIETPMKLLSLLNDITVSPKEKVKNAAVLDDAAIDRLARLPGVAAAFPNIRLRGIKVRHGEKTETCLAAGVPREAALLGVSEEILVAGHFFSQGKQREVILGGPLSHSLGFANPKDAIGATLTLEASGLSPGTGGSFTMQQKKMTVTVVGVYELPMVVPEPARNGVLLPVDIMKEVPGIHFESAIARLKAGGASASAGYGSVVVRVRDAADLTTVEEQIKKMGFDAHTMLSRFKEVRMFLIFLQVLLGAVGTVALVVAALGIINTLLMTVIERQQEIGICKAIGASNGDIAVMFLTEAALLGLLGGLGGLLLGRVVSWILEIVINAYARSQGATEAIRVFAFPFWLLACTVLFAVGVSVLAGVWPALRAARIDPIRALRRG
jgi:ABC-type antimicrobial peptide transport system permease subunit